MVRTPIPYSQPQPAHRISKRAIARVRITDFDPPGRDQFMDSRNKLVVRFKNGIFLWMPVIPVIRNVLDCHDESFNCRLISFKTVTRQHAFVTIMHLPQAFAKHVPRPIHLVSYESSDTNMCVERTPNYRICGADCGGRVCMRTSKLYTK